MSPRVTSTVNGLLEAIGYQCQPSRWLARLAASIMNVFMKPHRFIFPLPAIFVLALFGVLAAAPAWAQESKLITSFEDWEAYREKDGGKLVCYIGSEPRKSKGKYKKRDETYVLITHRPAEKSTGVVSIKAGYAYEKDSEVEVIIGADTFRLFTDAGHAFAYDAKADKALVKAMKHKTFAGYLATAGLTVEDSVAGYKVWDKHIKAEYETATAALKALGLLKKKKK